MRRIITLHDILTAWQDGVIDYREAMEKAQIETLDELYDAANVSGVRIRTALTDDETAQARIVAELIRGQTRRKAA